MAEQDTVNACHRDLTELLELQLVLDRARDLITGRLETAADSILDVDPQAIAKLHCTKCRWVLDGFEQDPFQVRFRTTCGWCEWTEFHLLWPSAIDERIRELDERKTA